MNQAEQEVEMCACVFMCREMEQGRDVGTIIECDFVWETDRLTGEKKWCVTFYAG